MAKITVENSPNSSKDMNLHIQEVEQTPNRANSRDPDQVTLQSK